MKTKRNFKKVAIVLSLGFIISIGFISNKNSKHNFASTINSQVSQLAQK